MIKLCIVVPCFNESEVIGETATRLREKLDELRGLEYISDKSRVIFTDDGSADDTWSRIEALNSECEYFEGCRLSRNFGHQKALLAGLSVADGRFDAVVTIDADLQDDINVIDGFIDAYNSGAQVVYGVRNDRSSDSAFKRATALAFYRFMRLLGCEIVADHADCRLMSARAVHTLLEFKEVNLFLRGLVPMVGYKTAKVYYRRSERFAGKSKYPLKKMLGFALDGITSLSVKPIRIISWTGLLCFFLSLIMLAWSIAGYFSGTTISGWASLITSIWALGGLQLLAIGIIGEYISKIYLETKNRPRFTIEKTLKND